MRHEELDAAIVQMRQDGHILADIALELNCTQSYVNRVLAKNNLTYQDLLEQKREEIRKLWDQGLQPAEIAAHVGASITYVYELCRGRSR